MKKFSLTVIIPSYNEEENVKMGVLKHVYDFLKGEDLTWEVLVSDDGSTDGSCEIIKGQIKNWDNFRILENLHGGKPSALLHGIREAKGDYVLFSDMDQSTPITELNKILPFVGPGVGAVIGSRGLTRKNFPVYRRVGAIVFATFRKLFILPEINDTQCGFKLFSRDVAAKAFPRLQFFRDKRVARGWVVTSFDVELLHIIKKMGYTIEEVPVLWQDADKSVSKGGSLGRYFKESKEMLIQILRVKWNDMRGFYDILT